MIETQSKYWNYSKEYFKIKMREFRERKRLKKIKEKRAEIWFFYNK